MKSQLHQTGPTSCVARQTVSKNECIAANAAGRYARTLGVNMTATGQAYHGAG